MSKVFINATTARSNTRDNTVIHAEVRGIESAILANVDAGVLYANVSTGTTMTSSNVYYKQFAGISDDRTVADQLSYVQQYFRDLGYGIYISTNPSTETTIVWNVSW